MQIIPRRNVCRTFDIERYYVLVIQSEFYTSIFSCICQRETRTANYASNFESQGIDTAWCYGEHRPCRFSNLFVDGFAWSVFVSPDGFQQSRPPRSRFRGDGPSFNGWWFGPRRQWNLKPWSHINRCPKQMHNRFRYYRLWVCCSIPNSWHSQILDVIMWWHMYFAFICFFSRNQFWWRHMQNHMKHLARNSAKVLRWVATRSGPTTLAVRATTLPCPPWPIGRRQNVGPAVELLVSAVICWSQMQPKENHGWNWKAKQNLWRGIITNEIWGNWMIVNSGDHPLRIRTWPWPHWHVRSPPGALGWKGGWPLEDWAGGPRRRGGWRDFPPQPVGPQKLETKISDLLGGMCAFF